MRAINLLPPESFEKARNRQRIVQIALLGVIYLVLLALLTAWWQQRVNSAEDDVDEQLAVNADLEAQVAQLQGARALVDRYDANAQLITTALGNDVSWGRILNDLGRMIPERVWIESFVGAADQGADAGVGSVSFSGVGFDFPDVSSWLRSLDSDRFPSVSGTWVTSISRATVGEAETANFASSTSLTEAARSDRVFERVPEVPR